LRTGGRTTASSSLVADNARRATAGLLVLTGAAFGVIDPRCWWIWALLVGVGTPLFEIGDETGSGSLAAFVFRGVGAVGGAGASRLLQSERPVRLGWQWLPGHG
jgi:hypothetical protein